MSSRVHQNDAGNDCQFPKPEIVYSAMCTNFVFIKSNATIQFSDQLGIDESGFLYQPHVKPGAKISIIVDSGTGFKILDATWWLFLKQTDEGLKPHPDYFSVNTNYAKLPNRLEFRVARCVVPATAFMESQSGKNPHLLTPEDGRVIAFGGLYKVWVDKITGVKVHSASIITLPGHPSLKCIHGKSTPLWLTDQEVQIWLDRELKDTVKLTSFLAPKLVVDLIATPIEKVGNQKVIGQSFKIRKATLP